MWRYSIHSSGYFVALDRNKNLALVLIIQPGVGLLKPFHEQIILHSMINLRHNKQYDSANVSKKQQKRGRFTTQLFDFIAGSKENG